MRERHSDSKKPQAPSRGQRLERVRLDGQASVELPETDGLLEALRLVALGSWSTDLSSREYEEHRRLHPEEHLPPAAEIRKWFGSWPEALRRAGVLKRSLIRLEDALFSFMAELLSRVRAGEDVVSAWRQSEQLLAERVGPSPLTRVVFNTGLYLDGRYPRAELKTALANIPVRPWCMFLSHVYVAGPSAFRYTLPLSRARVEAFIHCDRYDRPDWRELIEELDANKERDGLR